jgi:hypothetical protein
MLFPLVAGFETLNLAPGPISKAWPHMVLIQLRSMLKQGDK